MRLELHPQVATDISRIMDYYEGVAGSKLADDFYIELRSFFQKVASSPEAYDICVHDLRRVNLEKFPCSVSFAIECVSWLFVTTKDDRRWAFAGDEAGDICRRVGGVGCLLYL